jgi:hypothetical protein
MAEIFGARVGSLNDNSAIGYHRMRGAWECRFEALLVHALERLEWSANTR